MRSTKLGNEVTLGMVNSISEAGPARIGLKRPRVRQNSVSKAGYKGVAGLYVSLKVHLLF